MSTERNTKRVTMNLPEDIVSKLDVLAKVTFKNRTQVTREALQQFIEDFEMEGGIRETIIEEYLKGNLDDEDLEAVLGPYDAKAVETAQSIYDRGDSLAEEIAEDL